MESAGGSVSFQRFVLALRFLEMRYSMKLIEHIKFERVYNEIIVPQDYKSSGSGASQDMYNAAGLIFPKQSEDDQELVSATFLVGKVSRSIYYN